MRAIKIAAVIQFAGVFGRSVMDNYENRVLAHKLQVPAIRLNSRTLLRTATQRISIPSGGTTARTPSHTKTPVAEATIA